MSFVKTYAFLFSVPTTPGGNTYSWQVGANWAYGVPIGNYGSPYVGAVISGSPYHTGEVALDDYGPGTIVSVIPSISTLVACWSWPLAVNSR